VGPNDPALPTAMPLATSDADLWKARWQRLSAAFLVGFHRYASWLVSISWRRVVLLALALIIIANILPNLPPFSWSVTETIEDTSPRRAPHQPRPPEPPKAPTVADVPKVLPPIHIDKPASGAGKTEGLDISIDERGIRITPRSKGTADAAASAASAASGATVATGATASASASVSSDGQVTISLPPGMVDKEAVREAVTEARHAIEEALRTQREAAQEAAEAAREAREAAREAAQEAARDAEDAAAEIRGPTGKIKRIRKIHWGDFLIDLALLWIMASAVIKATYKGRIQAEAKAAQATETAEAESLRRQVVEARMAAMQAQVEPHFLFNTLASIDHLIETDPPRASKMQKNLIALLRASMPTLREADTNLGRELAVIRPYLEILKVRMEERLQTEINVSDGLLSAEFPPMMLQSLVENAIKHGLEPKAEGGTLTVAAEIVDGNLEVSVAGTGLGFGKAATAGTGLGLTNIRERLLLLYGQRAQVAVTENAGGGTRVTITVPYRSKARNGGASR
jgi:signal transduction histidine kinase